MTNKSEYNIEHILQVMIKAWTWLVSWRPYCQQGWKQYCLYLGVHTVNKAENNILCILQGIWTDNLNTNSFSFMQLIGVLYIYIYVHGLVLPSCPMVHLYFFCFKAASPYSYSWLLWKSHRTHKYMIVHYPGLVDTSIN